MIQLAIPGPRQPVANDLAAGSLQRGGAGMGGGVVLGREPADVADLAKECGGQRNPMAADPELLPRIQ